MSFAFFIEPGLISIVISQLLSISKLVLIESNIFAMLIGSNKFGVPPPMKIVFNLDCLNFFASFSISFVMSFVYVFKDSKVKAVGLIISCLLLFVMVIQVNNFVIEKNSKPYLQRFMNTTGG